MRLPGWFFHQTWSARSLEQKKQISIIPGNKEITNSNLRYRFIFLLNNCNILLMKWWRRTLILSGYTACSIDTIRCPNELRSQRSRVGEASEYTIPGQRTINYFEYGGWLKWYFFKILKTNSLLKCWSPTKKISDFLRHIC